MSKYILAIDQGTSSSKAVLLNADSEIVASSENVPITSCCPQPGWVEFRPEEMFASVVQACRSVVEKADISPKEIACVGLANQGETVIAFDRNSGEPVCPAISWQDKRGHTYVERWQADGQGEMIREITGLIPDAYFSASKMCWVIENIPEVQRLHEAGALCMATSDTWLIHQLLQRKRFLTDVSTASRTMLLNLESLHWDEEMLRICGIPRSVLPDIVPNDAMIGVMDKNILGVEIPVGGLCVDQQAALFGQRCFDEGEMKITYGTGCFMLANVGSNAGHRAEGLLTSVGWQVRDLVTYVLDGGIYSAGALVRWLTDQIRIASSIQDIEQAIAHKKDANGVYFIPALTGLAAPYWNAEMHGSWQGLRLANDRSDLLRSAIESIAFRVNDVFQLMAPAGIEIECIRVDGGLSQSGVLMQLQADLLDVPIEVFKDSEATALGVGLLAGIAALGWRPQGSDFPVCETHYRRFEPDRERHTYSCQHYAKWKELVLEAMGENANGN